VQFSVNKIANQKVGLPLLLLMLGRLAAWAGGRSTPLMENTLPLTVIDLSSGLDL